MEEHRIGVIGAGTMGIGIAYVFAAARFGVVVAEPSPPQAVRFRNELRAATLNAVSRGKLTAETAEELSERVDIVSSVDDLPEQLALIVETVSERPALKAEVLRAAELRQPSVLATNTSSISIDVLARNLAKPERFVGMHFFNPVWSLPLVEIVRGSVTNEDTLNAARRHTSEIGKQFIVVRDLPGFATSRLDFISALEAMRMLEDGVASAEDIDRAAVLAYRHPVGPLRLSDIVGLDVRLDIARQLEATYGERYRPPQILVDIVARGHLGQKSGQGFYEWPTS